MKLVASGMLAALLGSGCAFESGDPGDARTGEVAADPATSASAAPDPDEGGVPLATADDVKRENNPEPSPWHAVIPSSGALRATGSTESSGRGSAAAYQVICR
jgi:hypothetical protein